jgi:hypothetical protein
MAFYEVSKFTFRIDKKISFAYSAPSEKRAPVKYYNPDVDINFPSAEAGYPDEENK